MFPCPKQDIQLSPLSVRQEAHFTHRETRKVQRRRNNDDQTIPTTLTINFNPMFNLTCGNSIVFLFSLKTNVLGNNANIQMIRLDSRNIDSITLFFILKTPFFILFIPALYKSLFSTYVAYPEELTHDGIFQLTTGCIF